MATVGEQAILEKIAELQADIDFYQEDTTIAMTHMWLLICGAMVMIMHAGFAMLEAGCCRAAFVQSVLEKNLLNCCVSTAGWWVFGWALAYGDVPEKGVIGTSQFLSLGFQDFADDGTVTPSDGTLNWFFQWAFCMTCATIVSGAVAERLQIGGFCIFCFIMTSVVYPVIVAWTWSGKGWLNHVGVGFYDFAGSGIVHLAGGVGAFCGAKIVGVRAGRFEENVDQEKFEPHSVPLIVLGTLILWFGWYGFNCGSTLTMNAESGYLAAQVAVNTTLAPTFAGMTTAFVRRWQTGRWNTVSMCGGMLAGLVSITAGCGNVRGYSAVIIGIIGGLVYMGAGDLFVYKFKLDDPVEAAAIHGGGGLWGCIAAALFDWGKGSGHYNGWGGYTTDGVYGMGDGLLANIVGVLVIMAWSATMHSLIFLALKAFGFLRITHHQEALGLDEDEFTPTRAYSNAFSAKGGSMKVAPNKGTEQEV
jgi:Amt family ammonium transporter